MTSPDPSASADQPSESRNRLVLVVYTAAIFVSALLLFSVQPLFTKMVLPRLGGSPAVWSVAMVFFQSLLLGGYAYAHFLMQLRNRALPVAIHLVLLVVAMLTLPLSISSGWGDPPTSGYAFWLLRLFAVSIGLPFFALAATAPILQRWFADTDHPSAKDPYFLYAASNLGSLLALVLYPLVVEPTLRLRIQNQVWAIGFGVFALAACLSVVAGWRRKARAGAAPDLSGVQEAAASLTWERRATWIALAFIPSSLMLAVTTYFSTDIAPVPLFWIAPLALYLLTFVVAFSAHAVEYRRLSRLTKSSSRRR
jgi:hypothetical protein